MNDSPTLVDAALQWKAGELTLAEAASLGAEATKTVVKHRDPDDTIWFEGDEANTTVAIYALVSSGKLSTADATKFLSAVVKESS